MVEAAGGSHEREICVTVTRQDKYRFLVDFGPGVPQTAGDEPPPLGDGAGPSPEQLLGPAVANCLCSSLSSPPTSSRAIQGG